MAEIAGFKLLLSYDVPEEQLQEYYKFVMGRFLPAIQNMGLQMSEAWGTAYGQVPNRLIGFVCAEQSTMTEVLGSDTWQELHEQLLEYVTDFDYKVVPFRGGFQV